MGLGSRIKSWWNPGPAQQAMEAAGMEIMRRAAEYMAEKARELAPVDTGFLKSEIQIINASGSNAYHVVAMADYSQWVEFGHMTGSTFVAPNPFMRNALAATVAAFPSLGSGVRIDRPGGMNDKEFLGATFTT